MKRRRSDQQIEDELNLGTVDALHAVVGALWRGEFGLILKIDAALTKAYEEALSVQPKPSADREFFARQAFRLAMDHHRTHDSGPES